MQNLIFDWDGTLAVTEAAGAAHPIQPSAPLPSYRLDQDINDVPGEFDLFLRPHSNEVLHALSTQYNLAIWTFAMPGYIRACLRATSLERLFPPRQVISRQEMADWKTKVKDLFLLCSRLGWEMRDTVIVDDSNTIFGVLNPFNCVDIPTWRPAQTDDKRLLALPRLVERQFDLLSRYSERDLLLRRRDLLRTQT